MNNDSYNSYEEMRQKIYDIADEVSEEEGIDISINPVTIVTYYKSDVFKKNLKLYKFSGKVDTVVSPFTDLGYYSDKSKEVVIFLNHFKHFFVVYSSEYLVNVIYHELRHVIQDQKISTMDGKLKYDIDKFKIDLDACRIYDSIDYRLFHDWYSHEIDADTYAAAKTRRYFSKRAKTVDESFFDLMDFYNKYRNSVYNIQISIDKVSKLMKNNKEKVNKFFEKCFLLRNYFDENGNYREIQALMNDPIVNNWDVRIRHNIFASKSFLSQIDLSKLSKEELDYVLDSVSYVCEDRNKRNKKSKQILDDWNNKSFMVNEYNKSGKGINYYLFYLDAMIQMAKNRNVFKYYDYLDKILDEYKYHDKIDEGGKKL